MVICALSRTPVAAAVRKDMIDLFMAYRHGEMVRVQEHMTSFFRAFRDQPEALAEWAIGIVKHVRGVHR